jgi:hypothetical protein
MCLGCDTKESGDIALRDLGFIDGGEFRLLVRVPDATPGTRYPISLRLSGAGAASTARVEVMVAELRYLPVIAD